MLFSQLNSKSYNDDAKFWYSDCTFFEVAYQTLVASLLVKCRDRNYKSDTKYWQKCIRFWYHPILTSVSHEQIFSVLILKMRFVMPISIDYQCIFDTLKLILFGDLVALNKTLVFLLKTYYCGTKFFYLCTLFWFDYPSFLYKCKQTHLCCEIDQETMCVKYLILWIRNFSRKWIDTSWY